MAFFGHMRAYMQRPLVRPWALTGPVVILLICLPLLRPLRQPDPNRWSNQEQMIAATAQAIVEQHSLQLDKSVFQDSPVVIHRNGHIYSPFSPVLPILLAPIYAILHRQGLTYADDLIFVQYLMTLFGATLPLAICAGLLYRLGRMFEIRRSLRVGLSLTCILGTGLICFGLALNRYAPAAMLLMMAVSAMSHLIVTRHPHRDLGFALFAGLVVTLGACIDAPVAVFAALLPTIFLAMRWSSALRLGAIAMYVLGAAIPLLASEALARAGAAPPAFVDATRMVSNSVQSRPIGPTDRISPDLDDESDSDTGAIEVLWARVSGWIGRALEGLVGAHGILSHYPVLVVGLLGATWILHRNWTNATKMLASVTLAGSALLILIFCAAGPRPMGYGAPWFVAVAPVLMLWAGAWLKRPHRTQSWIMVGIILSVSLITASIGMSNPMPRYGYTGYSLGQATMRLLRTNPPAGD